MNVAQMKKTVLEGGIDSVLLPIYGKENVAPQKARYAAALDGFAALYGEDREVRLFSVAGRSELSGNHTDHNHGCVVAASIDLDIIAVASPRQDSVVCLKSEGFPQDTVDLSVYTAPDPAAFGSSASIIAGVAAGFVERGYRVGGFDAYTTSNVLKGSGLSSSAAFEDMVGNVLNHFYNQGQIDNVEIAKISQLSENRFFGKPCGLMDQVACAVGGIVAIDFRDPKAPVIDRITLDMSAMGYNLCIVNTGGNHADLTDDYASVPAEMKAVAAAMGQDVLREVCPADVIAAIPALRETLGDRALLRAMHFFHENDRVLKQKDALLREDLPEFFRQVKASGLSSFCYLQNVYTSKNLREQGLSLALCLAEEYLSGRDGAWRVHGGGFAGTIQAFVPVSEVEGFRTLMDGVFGEGSCIVLRIRPAGAVCLA